jgi:hypothetical protein
MFTYEDVIPTLIPNTTMQKKLNDGVFLVYAITPNEGYVLHDNAYDFSEPDPETGGIIPLIGYRTTTATCAAAYDFSTAEMVDEAGNTVLAYGSRQFYTKLASDVPADQIFGGGDNEQEVM